jgi:hypothetical protein
MTDRHNHSLPQSLCPFPPCTLHLLLSLLHVRGMSAAAGMSATVGEGQKLWTTLLLGLADIMLAANIWGHARDQQQATQAMADSKAVRKQVRTAGGLRGCWGC